MRHLVFIISIVVFLIGCGSSKQDRLNELEAQKEAIEQEIADLRAEIAQENGSGFSTKVAYVDLEKIVPAEFKHFINVQGTVESDNNILIPAKSSGIVKKILVREGEFVQKDQLLAELDGAILEKTISEIETNLELATTVFERQERLWNKKIGSEIQYLQAKTNKESLEKRLASIKEQYKLTKIISPISGKVDQILIKEGEAAAAGFGTIRVVNQQKLKITAKLSEVNMGKIKTGDPVEVSIPMLGMTFNSEIVAVSQVIDPQNRTFPIEVRLPSDDKRIKPNMLVRLTINDYQNVQALTIPVNTIQKTGDQMFLFTAEETGTDSMWKVTKRMVTLGNVQDNRAEIRSGLQPGEYVVVFGFQNLADGQAVKETNN